MGVCGSIYIMELSYHAMPLGSLLIIAPDDGAIPLSVWATEAVSFTNELFLIASGDTVNSAVGWSA